MSIYRFTNQSTQQTLHIYTLFWLEWLNVAWFSKLKPLSCSSSCISCMHIYKGNAWLLDFWFAFLTQTDYVQWSISTFLPGFAFLALIITFPMKPLPEITFGACSPCSYPWVSNTVQRHAAERSAASRISCLPLSDAAFPPGQAQSQMVHRSSPAHHRGGEKS